MERIDIRPREGFESIIEEQGLVYWRTELGDGEVISYWHEGAHYSLSETEVYEIEASARLLVQEMLVEAGDYIIAENLFHRMGIPGWAVPRIKETWESEPPMVYGRFDFAYGPDGLRLLEYNADTPTALLETAAVQWEWCQSVYGAGADQWNTLHEALVARWRELAEARRLPGGKVHLLHTSEERSGEDFMTVGYMAEVLREAGVDSELMPIERVGVRGVGEPGFVDLAEQPIRTAFKLYPWEWMVHEEFGEQALRWMGDGLFQTTWIEPIWKMLWSNKGILPVLHRLYPDADVILPAYFADEKPAGLQSFVKKPLLAREGANTTVVIDGREVETGPDQSYGDEGFVYQAYTDLGEYGAARARPVLGVWTVDMEPRALGIRESDSLITDNLSRFVPHTID
jgi:glutathionylspermidine synthase